MSKAKNHRNRRLSPVWVLLGVGLLGVGALAAYVQLTPANTVAQEDRPTISAEAPTTGGSVSVLKPRYEGDELKFDRSEQSVPDGVDAKVYAVNRFLEQSSVAPAEARAVSCSIQGRTATIEFSKAFDRTYGTEDEHTLVDGVLRSMGQFPEIDSVQFNVAGEPLETLGNIDLTSPQPVLRQ